MNCRFFSPLKTWGLEIIIHLQVKGHLRQKRDKQSNNETETSFEHQQPNAFWNMVVTKRCIGKAVSYVYLSCQKKSLP